MQFYSICFKSEIWTSKFLMELAIFEFFSLVKIERSFCTITNSLLLQRYSNVSTIQILNWNYTLFFFHKSKFWMSKTFLIKSAIFEIFTLVEIENLFCVSIKQESRCYSTLIHINQWGRSLNQRFQMHWRHSNIHNGTYSRSGFKSFPCLLYFF